MAFWGRGEGGKPGPSQIKEGDEAERPHRTVVETGVILDAEGREFKPSFCNLLPQFYYLQDGTQGQHGYWEDPAKEFVQNTWKKSWRKSEFTNAAVMAAVTFWALAVLPGQRGRCSSNLWVGWLRVKVCVPKVQVEVGNPAVPWMEASAPWRRWWIRAVQASGTPFRPRKSLSGNKRSIAGRVKVLLQERWEQG